MTLVNEDRRSENTCQKWESYCGVWVANLRLVAGNILENFAIVKILTLCQITQKISVLKENPESY